MKKLKVIFSKPINHSLPIGSLAIKWYLGTDYSHVCWGFYSEKLDREIKYEAVGSGIRFIGSRRWEESAVAVKTVEIEVPEDIYYEMMAVGIDYAGQDYGFSQNFGVVLADIFGLTTNPFPNNQNCSEIMARLLQKAGYKFNKNLNLVTPKDIEISLNEGKT